LPRLGLKIGTREYNQAQEKEREEEEKDKNIQEKIRLLRKKAGKLNNERGGKRNSAPKRRKLNEKNEYNESRVVQIETITIEIGEKRKSGESENANDNPDNNAPNPKRVRKFQQDIRLFACPQVELDQCTLLLKNTPPPPHTQTEDRPEQCTETNMQKQGPPLSQVEESVAACLQPEHEQHSALEYGQCTETLKLNLRPPLAQEYESQAACLQPVDDHHITLQHGRQEDEDDQVSPGSSKIRSMKMVHGQKQNQGPPLAQAAERLAACLQPEHDQRTDGPPTHQIEIENEVESHMDTPNVKAAKGCANRLYFEHFENISLIDPPNRKFNSKNYANINYFETFKVIENVDKEWDENVSKFNDYDYRKDLDRVTTATPRPGYQAMDKGAKESKEETTSLKDVTDELAEASTGMQTGRLEADATGMQTHKGLGQTDTEQADPGLGLDKADQEIGSSMADSECVKGLARLRIGTECGKIVENQNFGTNLALKIVKCVTLGSNECIECENGGLECGMTIPPPPTPPLG
jgi:hypothetical protein